MPVTGLSIAAAFLLGLASTLHCWGMCGGIIAALSLGVATADGMTSGRRVLLITGFNAGRILSYAVAGVVAGAAGGALLALSGRSTIYPALQLGAAALLILVGLHLAGWLPGLGALEVIGSRLWRWLQPAGRAFLPVDNLPRALALGALWGWLPCGLVYSTLLWSSAHADPVSGGLAMAAFGLGTLPGMSIAGLASQRLLAAGRRAALRRTVAVLIISIGVFSGVAAVRGPADRTPAEHVHG